jgi:UDP-2,4-diacetamido-2,4,6-trideoxy-beta-L-altropyranose hydrolase
MSLVIVFRVDSSLEMGSGHVMRCLTLAMALQQIGAAIHFICRDLPGNLMDMIRQQGFYVHALGAKLTNDLAFIKDSDLKHASWLGVSQQQDAEESAAILQALRPTWLIVDHYALDYRWQKQIKNYTNDLMVIDDLADRMHDCDVLLDQTYARKPDSYQGLVPVHCKLLLGTNYALLREEFLQWRPFSLQRRDKPALKQVLVTLGGVDKDNMTSKVIDALEQSSRLQSAHIDIVMGKSSPHLEVIKHQVAKSHLDISIKTNVTNMAELMAHSDFCIGAAGTTTWERCCLGLPSVLLVLADNQQTIATTLGNVGVVLLEDKSSIRERMGKRIDELRIDGLKNLSIESARLVDGMGAQRVAEYVNNV